MYVYIETVILDNFLIDSLLLVLTNKFTKCPVSALGIVLSSTFGTGFALFSPYLDLSPFWLILTKLVVAIIMVLLSLPSIYRLFHRLFCFLGLTFAFGGVMIALFYFLGTPVNNAINLSYSSSIPLGGILAVALAFAMLLTLEIRKFYSIRRLEHFLIDVTICVRNNPMRMRGYLDTGNGLIDNCGKPVVIINEKDLRYWFSTSERVDLLLHRFDCVKIANPHILRLSTVSKSNSLVVFDADYILVGNRKLPVSIGVQSNTNSISSSFDVLLNQKLLEVT